MHKVAGAAAVLTLALMQLAPAGEAVSGPARSEIVFAPHRAVYDLTLDGTRLGSGVSEVTGRIVYELTGSACEGYAQSMRYVTQTVSQDGEPQTTDLRTSSWESVPPRRLRFSSSTYRNEQAIDQTQGIAERSGTSGQVKVTLTRPAKRTHDVATDVYFPIQHSMALITAAREGKRTLSADLYDGSEGGDKYYATTTAIGRQVSPGAKTTLAGLKDGDKLDRVPSWPVSIGYFKPAQGHNDGLPLYEMSYRFHENGVTSSLRIDHGEFAIKGDLKELSYLEAGKCPQEKP
jgi:EipB-like